MTHTLDVARAAGTVAGILYIVLGLWVLTLTPRRRETLLLAAFAVLAGLGFALVNLLFIFHILEGGFRWWLFGGPIFAASALAALGLAATVSGGLEEPQPLAIALGLGVLASLPEVVNGSLVFPVDGVPLVLAVGWDLLLFGSVFAAAILLALRSHPSRKPEADEVWQLAILAVSLAVFWGVRDGRKLALLPAWLAHGETASALEGITPLLWIAVAGLWGRNMLDAGPTTRRIHRGTMLAMLGLLLVGALLRTSGAWRQGIWVVRTLGVALLAYGVLRHDIAGLDAKVEWGVSKTTVAGIFVAVFFVAGEFAETFFGDVLGDYLGVIAAGALVFAISPLQRVADSFAAKAVPGGAEAGADVEARYRAALEATFADGEITREEERHLADLAEELGVGPRRALELREELEEEREGGDPR